MMKKTILLTLAIVLVTENLFANPLTNWWMNWQPWTILLVATGIGVLLWFQRRKKANQRFQKLQKELLESQSTLKKMQAVLLERDALVKVLKEQVSQMEVQQKALKKRVKKPKNLYNQRILTSQDWAAFKSTFEKSNPGYLSRLRETHPNLSEAEERLFLFIKLNLTRKEVAAILGISADSVKKTRNRLRKRLELNQGDSLEAFIQGFERTNESRDEEG